MKSGFLKYLFIVTFISIAQLSAKYPTHSIMPMLGLASTGINNYSLRVSHGLQVTYSSGERMRTPLGIRYQYRMKKGNILGIDFSMIHNPILIIPQYLDATSGFSGPSVAMNRSMTGGNIHYSKTIDIKLIEVFGMAGFGGYFMGRSAINNKTDYLWYKDAGPGFYEFAPAVTNNALVNFMPVLAFGFGARLKHLEAGLHNQISFTGPIQAFSYKDYKHNVPLNWKSIGYYVGYRFEF